MTAMSVSAFRIFQDRQPAGQRLELVDGVPIMMTPPTIAHQKIAWNLTRLLNDALDAHDPSLIAVFTPGINLGLEAEVIVGVGKGAGYVPEPDIAVIENVPDPDQRIVRAAHLLAEVVSSTDDITVLGGGRPWIDVKAALYRRHGPCEAVLVIAQEHVEVRLWHREGEGWSETILSDRDDLLAIPSYGLRCAVGAIYTHTHLASGGAGAGRSGA